MAESPLIGSRDIQHKGPLIRLLRCMVCNSWEELPDWDGAVEEDFLLEVIIEKHKFPSGEPHKGKLFKIPMSYWADREKRKAVLDQLGGGGSLGLDAFDPDKSFYESKMQFSEDAMTCWKSKLKPTDGCAEYGSPEKRILPKTAIERKELGLPSPKDAPGPKIYICNFCPIHSVVTTKARNKQGMYDK
jgi:hypothetical protein